MEEGARFGFKAVVFIPGRETKSHSPDSPQQRKLTEFFRFHGVATNTDQTNAPNADRIPGFLLANPSDA
jgi:hypothetical protein